MSNAFDKLMDPKNKPDTSSTSSGGRPMHDAWFGYEKVYVEGRVAAKCCNCFKTFGNTHQPRLLRHR